MKKIVTIGLEEIIGADLEGFLNLLEGKCGENILEDIKYRVVGEQQGAILVEVIANEIIFD